MISEPKIKVIRTREKMSSRRIIPHLPDTSVTRLFGSHQVAHQLP